MIIDTFVNNNKDLTNLNDHDLGIVEGYISAKAGKSLDDVITMASKDGIYLDGIKEGFNMYAKEKLNELKDSLKQAIYSYKKSRSTEDFIKVLDCYSKIADEEQDFDYELYTDENGVEKIGLKFSSAEDAKKFLEEDSSLKVISEGDDGVVLGEANVTDSFLSKKARLKDMYYLKGRLFDSKATLVSTSVIDILKRLK